MVLISTTNNNNRNDGNQTCLLISVSKRGTMVTIIYTNITCIQIKGISGSMLWGLMFDEKQLFLASSSGRNGHELVNVQIGDSHSHELLIIRLQLYITKLYTAS